MSQKTIQQQANEIYKLTLENEQLRTELARIKPDWNVITWANYRAYNLDGTLTYFEQEPSPDDDYDEWSVYLGNAAGHLREDWRETLERRPEES